MYVCSLPGAGLKRDCHKEDDDVAVLLDVSPVGVGRGSQVLAPAPEAMEVENMPRIYS